METALRILGGSTITLRSPAILVILVMLLTSLSILSEAPAQETKDKDIIPIDLMIDNHLIENDGQLEDDSIKFYTLGQFRVALGNDFIRYSLERKTDEDTGRIDCWQIGLIDALAVEPEGIDPTDTAYNFFYEDDQITGVTGYQAVLYENLYPNIDLLYHFSGSDLKYDLIMRPGSDPSNIVLGVSGHESLTVIENELVIELGDGTLILERGLDVFYQDTNEKIPAKFELVDEDTFTFSLGEFDPSRIVVIDPLVFSTWIGGQGGDQGNGMYVDGDGNTYVTGHTTAREFPVTPGAYSVDWNGSQDSFLFKMNNDGTNLTFCTLIGGSSDESGMVIDLDDSGNIYLSGRVASSDFPTTANAYDDTYHNLYDIFVCKFDPTASNLIFSTYVGGRSSEWPLSIAVDDFKNIFVGGIINGEGFPTSSNAIGESYGGWDIDGFLFKMNPGGRQLIYSTYIGGDHDDKVTDLVVDDEGYAYISGTTRSSDFILTSGAYDTTRDGSSDAYIMKVSHDGTTPIYSTLFGGSISETIYDLEMTDEGDLVFTGLTYSTDLPTTSGMAHTSHIGDADIFLTQMDINCTIVKKCTYLGSDDYEKPLHMDIDPNGRISIMGTTASINFPITPDAIMGSNNGASNNFLMTILADWSDIQYGTYLGGGTFDIVGGVGTDDRGQIYAVASTDNENFPTTAGSFDTTNNGFEDIYVFSISLDTPPTPPRDLQARAGDGFVDLTWNIPTSPGSLDLTGYDVFRGEDPASKSLLATVGEVLQYNDTDVENGKTYYYHIRAKNSALDSIPSPEVEAIPMGPPGAPLNFQVVGGYMKVDLSWEVPEMDGGTPILGYHIFRINDHIEIMFTVDPSETGYIDEAIMAGTEYEYNINAYNIVGESLVADPVKATPVSEPTSPMNLSLRSGDGFVEISWSPPDNDGGMILKEYNVYRGVNGGELTLLKNMGAGVRKYNDTTVHNGLSYEYNVVAVNLIGESLPTEILMTIPMTLPGVPLNFLAISSHAMVTLEWEEPITDGGSSLIGYRIKKVVGDEEPVYIDVDDLEYTDESVEDGTSYTYSVASINSVGVSTWSEELQVIPAQPPSSPEVHLRSRGVGHIHIEWNEPALNGGREILSYELYRGMGDQDLGLYKTFDRDTLDFNDTNVITGALYRYGLSAINSVGASIIPNYLEVVPAGIPSPPLDISIIIHDGFLGIIWTEPVDYVGDDIIDYFVHRTDLSSGTKISIDLSDSVIGPVFSYEDEDVVPGVTYEYYVTARNSIGHGSPSRTIEGTVIRAPGQILDFNAELLSGAVKLTWNAMDLSETGDVTIEIMRIADNGGPLTIAILDGSETSYTDSNIREGVQYTYNITAYNDAGSSRTEIDDIDTSVDVSPGINAAGLTIMILGTLIPLIIAIILIFLLIKSRRDEETEKEETPSVEAPQEEVIGAPLGTSPPTYQQNGIPSPPAPEMQPQLEQIPQEPAPVVNEQQVPIQEEIPLQEEPDPFLDSPEEQAIPPEIEPSQEVIQ